MEPTRLYFSTEKVSSSGDGIELISFQHEQGFPDAFSVRGREDFYRAMRNSGKITMVLKGTGLELVQFFHTADKVLWTIELPKNITWMFEGYISEIEQSIGVFAECKIKVYISGPVTCHYDGPNVVPSTEDVFSRKASKAQAKTYGEIRRTVTYDESTAVSACQGD